MDFLSAIYDLTGGVKNPLVFSNRLPSTGEVEHKSVYTVDTTAGPVVLTCPASPHESFEFIVVDISGNFKINNCTINFNGNLFRGDPTLILNVDWTFIWMQFLSGQWLIKTLYTGATKK